MFVVLLQVYIHSGQVEKYAGKERPSHRDQTQSNTTNIFTAVSLSYCCRLYILLVSVVQRSSNRSDSHFCKSYKSSQKAITDRDRQMIRKKLNLKFHKVQPGSEPSASLPEILKESLPNRQIFHFIQSISQSHLNTPV